MWGNGLDGCVSGYGQVAVFCEQCNETSCSINFGKLFDRLRTCQLFKKDFAPWSYLVSWQIKNFLLFMFQTILLRIYCNSLHFQSFGWYPCTYNTILCRIYTYKRGNPARKYRWKKLSSNE